MLYIYKSVTKNPEVRNKTLTQCAKISQQRRHYLFDIGLAAVTGFPAAQF